MKKTLTLLLAIFMLVGAFVGCGSGTQEPADVCTITLNKSAINMTVYERQMLTATVTGGSAEAVVFWSTENPAVAEVSNGIVTAKGAGTTAVVAKLENGVTASCTVTVTKTNMVPVVDFTEITDNKLTIANGQSFKLNSIVSFGGKDCTDEDTVFTFVSSDTSVVMVSADGVITAVGTGSVQIVVTASWRGIGGEDAIGLKAAIDLSVINP